MPNAVMIFAAGLGTRMGALTQTCPKPLLQVGGTALVDHALALADAASVPRKVINVHYLADQVSAHLSPRADVQIADERSKLLDTGGGLKAARVLLDANPVFTLNSDAVWSDSDAFQFLSAAWDPSRMDALLLCVPLERAHGRAAPGDFTRTSTGALIRGGNAVYTGAQILSLDGLDEIEDDVFSLNDLWTCAAQAGRLFGIEYPGHWIDVGHPEGLVLANKLWDQWH